MDNRDGDDKITSAIQKNDNRYNIQHKILGKSTRDVQQRKRKWERRVQTIQSRMKRKDNKERDTIQKEIKAMR